jgi:hypothetical protein
MDPSGELTLKQHGRLTLETMLAMLQPGAIDIAAIAGRRVRWSWAATRRDTQEAKLVSDELKRLHLQLGAAEVIVHRAPPIED